MSPVPLELPVRPSEAVALGRVLLETAGHSPLIPDTRNRIAGRAGALRLETITPHFGSLARDPVHKSTFYLAVDGLDAAPLLLHFATATAPTGSVYRNTLLIGRAGDLVVNAVRFGPADRVALDAYAARIDAAFAPRAQGARSTIVLAPSAAAFESFRGVLKRAGRNLAATEGPYHEALWHAIRAGWREGWSAGIELDPADPLPAIRDCPFYSRFAIATGDFAAAAQLRIKIAEIRSVAKIARPFDFELSLENAPAPTTPDDIARALEAVRAQFVAPRLAPGADLDALASTALRYRALLSIRSPSPPPNRKVLYKVTAHTDNLDSIAATLA